MSKYCCKIGFISALILFAMISTIIYGCIEEKSPNLSPTPQEVNTKTIPTVVTKTPEGIQIRPESGWRLGPENAKVKIVVFSDFECPGCAVTDPVLKQTQQKYSDKVSLSFRHMPLSIHRYAQAAAEASEAAGEQGKFWELNDKIFELTRKNMLSEKNIRSAAESIGIDMKLFDEALASGRPNAWVQKDIEEAKKIGLRWTPYIFINGKLFEGNSFDQLNAMIEKEIN